MRRLLTLVFALFMLVPIAAPLLAQAPAPQQQPQHKEQTVYVTRTGKKYHTANCRYLSKSKVPISLKDAKGRGYTSCSVCRPPQ
jgi:hypothetical protein